MSRLQRTQKEILDVIDNGKDPMSAFTHFIGMAMAVFAALPIILKAAGTGDPVHVSSITIFAISMILLYAASTCYHYFNFSEKTNTLLKKLDHTMIFILIAGTYTPVCLIVLGGKTGIMLLSLVWGIAIVGIIIKWFFVFCPKWFSSILYIAMGWVCVLAFTQIINNLPHAAFMWLLIGGIIYTVGGVIYALKLPIFDKKHKKFGSHEIFHLFVMGGSFCHFVMMFIYVAGLPVK